MRTRYLPAAFGLACHNHLDNSLTGDIARQDVLDPASSGFVCCVSIFDDGVGAASSRVSRVLRLGGCVLERTFHLEPVKCPLGPGHKGS